MREDGGYREGRHGNYWRCAQKLVDTGNVLGFTGGVDMEVERIQGAKNVMFGGEGLFNTRLTGPGTIFLQTMPLVGVADVIAAHLPTTS